MANRSSSSLLIVLLLTSALFVSVAMISMPERAHAAGTVLLNGLAAGTERAGGTVIVTGSGWSFAAGKTCSLSSSPSSVTASGSCVMGVSGNIYGQFTVPYTLRGATYPVYVTVYNDTTHYEQESATLTITAGISLSPTSGRQGQTVTVTGGGFTSDGICSFTPGTPQIASSVCTVNGGVITAGSYFVVGTAGSYPSTINVVVNGSAPAQFTITQVPTLTVSPTSGPHGISVAVSGSGFSSSDTSPATLTFTGSGGALFTGTNNPTLSASGTFKIATGSFTVASSATLGVTYTLTLTGSTGDFATQTFIMASYDPGIVLTPTSGPQGTVVAVKMNSTAAAVFSTGDVGICTISSIPTGLIASSVCQIDSSGKLVTPVSGFVVASAAGGSYLVIVTGKLGDSASAVFTVTAGLTLSPNTGSPAAGSQAATEVTATGKGFRPGGPGGCTITTTPRVVGGKGVLYADTVGEALCTVTSAGVLTANFRVGTGSVWTASGYNVTVTGPLGDTAVAVFQETPTIVLSPTSGSQGTHVSVVGSGFNGTAGLCSISGTLWSSGSLSCVQSSDGTIVSSFYVNNTAAVPGSYIITVKDAIGLVPYAYKTFILGTGPSVTLSPSVVPGTVQTVTVTGSSWNTLDTSVSFHVLGLYGLYDSPSTRTCSVSSSSIASGCSFIVKLNARGGLYTIVFNGTQGDSTVAQFIVETTLFLTPTSGPAGTFVTMSGSGYLNNATTATCTAWVGSGTISQSPLLFPSSGSSALTCTIVNHVLSGSFTATLFTGVTSYSTHTVTISNVTAVQQGSVSATFTVIAPTVTLSPTSGPRGILVTVSGINFNLNDTKCTVVPTTCNTLGCSSCVVSSPGVVSGIYAVNGSAGPQIVVVRGFDPTLTKNYDNASATFRVQASITMMPTSGRTGTSVILTGTNFASADIGCTITSSPSGLITSSVCTLAGGSMAGAFVVGSGTNGSYTVIVTGTTGDTGQASFYAPGPPTLLLTPNPGPVGTGVVASGSSYLGTTCLLTSVPSNLFASASCSLSGGALSGGFTVASGASGSYVVTVQTNAGSGDSATTSFAVGGTATTATTAITTSTTFTTATTTPTTTQTTTSTTTVQTTSSVVSTTTTVSTATGPWTPPKCVIATATFGSEASPAVQFLRGFRDNLVLKTSAGSAFMQVFNAWYYSFSPSVAQFIASNDPIRAPIRVFLYPLLGILGISTFTYSLFSATPEFAIVMAGLVASSLIGLVYLTLPALVGMRRLLRRRSIAGISIARIAMVSLAMALLLIAVGEFAQSFVLLAVGSSALVLTCIIAVPTLAARAILRAESKVAQ